jgi:3-carboxy-cis,cis-muconate cycloisomerase
MTEPPMTSQLMTPLYASAAMRALMTDQARLQRLLDFEAALARAEAAVGIITATGAAVIGDACDAGRYDIAALANASGPSGNIAAAVVDALTEAVAVRDPKIASFVHWGATSQDVIDTALVLELRAAIDALLSDLDVAIKGFIALAGRHRRTLAVARTLMQHALPMPFGLKLAGYAAALGRSRERLLRLRREALALQFGGAAGTLAALGDHGMEVAERLAALLDLQLPDAPWHTHRDRLAEVAACFGILAGTCGKIARDVVLMMQTEVGEAFEPGAPGRGSSSTLSHKRNPVGAAAALSAAAVAPNLVATLIAAQVQEHERAPGGWHTDWMTFPALALVTSGALSAVVEIAQGLEIDVERLRANLELTGGQIMAEALSFALTEKMGRAEAHVMVQELSKQALREKRPLKELLLSNLRVKWQLGAAGIEKLFMPLTYQGSAQTFIDRLVVASQMRAPRRNEPRLAPEVRPEIRPEIRPEPRVESQPQASPQVMPEVRSEPRVDVPPQIPGEARPEPELHVRPAEPKLPFAPRLPAVPEVSPPVPVVEPPPPAAATPPIEPIVESAPPAPPASEPASEAPDLKLTVADRIEPQPEPAPAEAEPPSAFMEVLSRIKSEAEEVQDRDRQERDKRRIP